MFQAFLNQKVSNLRGEYLELISMLYGSTVYELHSIQILCGTVSVLAVSVVYLHCIIKHISFNSHNIASF